MKFISGKKSSMTQIWVGDTVVAVTPVQAGPCTVTQVKTKAQDGYEALQVAYGVRKVKNINKPQQGHYKAAQVNPAYVREFRVDNAANFKVGDVITVETFAVGDTIAVTGTSKGKGFQGVVKRHGFHGFRKTHGNKDQERMPGSIGPKGPAHVSKGMKMAGRMGGERVTVTNLEVAALDAANNILFVKGALPGAVNGYLAICGLGDLQVNLRAAATDSAPTAKIAETPTAEVTEAATVEPTAVAAEPVAAVEEATK
jgi:large subunit ribosomal protein L3